MMFMKVGVTRCGSWRCHPFFTSKGDDIFWSSYIVHRTSPFLVIVLVNLSATNV